MNDPELPPNDPEKKPPEQPAEIHSQEVHHPQVSALVPEHVAKGVFSTGAVVMHGGQEFILDFLLRMVKPHQVAARVVLPPVVVPRMIQALKQNLASYRQKFGEPKAPPTAEEAGQQQQQPSAQELYDQLKLSDDVLSGAYANAVMIGHTGTEFSFDFITNFFPRSAVSCRVFLSAPNVTRLLDSLIGSYEQYEKRMRDQQQQSGQSPPTKPTETHQPPPPDDAPPA